jgi:hypothetical protein
VNGGPELPPAGDPGEDYEVGGGEIARTDLAWSRSGLALAVSAAAILKVVIGIGDYRAPVVIFIVLAAGAIAWALSMAEARFVSQPTLSGHLHADQRKLRFVAYVTCVFAVSALVIALLPGS